MKKADSESDSLWSQLIKRDMRAKLVLLHDMTIKAAQRIYERHYVIRPNNFETEKRWKKLPPGQGGEV